jgi:tetratricopeptide (TPR) repeat protein
MRSFASIVLSYVLVSAGARLSAQPDETAQQHATKAIEFAQHGDLKSAEGELRKAVELSPSDSSLLTSLGGILAMEGDLPGANAYLARAVQLNPADAASRRNLAANQWQLGRLKEARANLDRLLRANPHDRIATYLLGMVAEKEKDYARSVKLLESVPDVMAQQLDSWAALGSSYYHLGQTEKARGALQHLLGPASNPRATFVAGRIAADAHDFSTAETYFRSVRSTYPDRAAVELEIAMAQYQAGRAGESEKTLLEAVNANQATSETYVLLCTMLSDEGSNIPALQVATRGVQAFPDSAEVLSVKGSVELNLRYFNDAVASYGQAVKLKGSAAALRGLGSAQWNAGMHERATATFEEAMHQFPRDARTYQVYATLLLDEGSPQEKGRAIDLLKQALALDDSAVEARYQLANLALENGNPEQARGYLERAIQLAPKDSRLHFAISRAYRRLGRTADASKETEIYQKLKAAEKPGKRHDSGGETQP